MGGTILGPEGSFDPSADATATATATSATANC